MQISYHDLVGREVIGAGGERLGRVADLEAERVADDLRVVALLVGLVALFARVWLARVGPLRLRPSRVPWRDVARIERQVHLHVHGLQPAERGSVSPKGQ
jgi:sporulation protein YlmC with PRC-barrel domain